MWERLDEYPQSPSPPTSTQDRQDLSNIRRYEMTSFSRLLKMGIALFALQILTVPSIWTADGISESLLLSVVPHRAIEDIRADLDHSFIAIKLDQRYTSAKETYEMVQARIVVRENELNEIELKLKNAKSSNDKSQAVALKASKDAAKQILDLLESRKNLRFAEVEAAQSGSELAQASKFVLELELEVSQKQVEHDSLQTAGTTAMEVNALSQTIRAIEGKYLEAQQEEAKKLEQLASRERHVVDQRLKLFDLQGKVLGDKR